MIHGGLAVIPHSLRLSREGQLSIMCDDTIYLIDTQLYLTHHSNTVSATLTSPWSSHPKVSSIVDSERISGETGDFDSEDFFDLSDVEPVSPTRNTTTDDFCDIGKEMCPDNLLHEGAATRVQNEIQGCLSIFTKTKFRSFSFGPFFVTASVNLDPRLEGGSLSSKCNQGEDFCSFIPVNALHISFVIVCHTTDAMEYITRNNSMLSKY